MLLIKVFLAIICDIKSISFSVNSLTSFIDMIPFFNSFLFIALLKLLEDTGFIWTGFTQFILSITLDMNTSLSAEDTSLIDNQLILFTNFLIILAASLFSLERLTGNWDIILRRDCL